MCVVAGGLPTGATGRCPDVGSCSARSDDGARRERRFARCCFFAGCLTRRRSFTWRFACRLPRGFTRGVAIAGCIARSRRFARCQRSSASRTHECRQSLRHAHLRVLG